MLFAILIFDPDWPLCKGYSLCIVAIFANFQNGLISQILVAFWSRFLHKKSLMACRVFYRMFLAFLIFDSKWPFCKRYSLCSVAIFGNFQNGLIFRILSVFWSRFFAWDNCIYFYSRFLYAFRNFNFGPKLTTLQRPQRLHSGRFCQFQKWSHFSNISCFLEPFFA